MSDVSLKLAQYCVAQPIIWAMKIGSVTKIESGRAVLAPAGGSVVALIVDERFLSAYEPTVGDWYVVFPDGHQSLIAAEIFEDSHGGYQPYVQTAS